MIEDDELLEDDEDVRLGTNSKVNPEFGDALDGEDRWSSCAKRPDSSEGRISSAYVSKDSAKSSSLSAAAAVSAVETLFCKRSTSVLASSNNRLFVKWVDCLISLENVSD